MTGNKKRPGHQRHKVKPTLSSIDFLEVKPLSSWWDKVLEWCGYETQLHRRIWIGKGGTDFLPPPEIKESTEKLLLDHWEYEGRQYRASSLPKIAWAATTSWDENASLCRGVWHVMLFPLNDAWHRFHVHLAGIWDRLRACLIEETWAE